MKCPKVTVIIPNYNHGRYLTERIDSVLNQTFVDAEVIILDDASRDTSHGVLLRYYTNPQVRIVVNSHNSKSAFPQWNRGIEMAKGEYVWIAESDDSAEPRFLETLVSILDENPDVGVVYCLSKLINQDGIEIGDSLNWTEDLEPKRWASDFQNHGRDEVQKYLIRKNTIPNASAVLSRRTVWQQVAPVDASFKLCGDWLHWGKMLLKSDVAYVAEPLNRWRDGSSNSRHKVSGVLEWKEGQRVLAYFSQELRISAAQMLDMLIRFADRCIDWSAGHNEGRVTHDL